MNKNALDFALAHIRQSWAWDRLTDEERMRMVETLERVSLAGSYRQQLERLYQAEYAFLFEIGYNPIDWRGNGGTV